MNAGVVRTLLRATAPWSRPKSEFCLLSRFPLPSSAEILQANDSLTHVINLYKQQVKGEIVNGNNTLNAHKQTGR